MSRMVHILLFALSVSHASFFTLSVVVAVAADVRDVESAHDTLSGTRCVENSTSFDVSVLIVVHVVVLRYCSFVSKTR